MGEWKGGSIGILIADLNLFGVTSGAPKSFGTIVLYGPAQKVIQQEAK